MSVELNQLEALASLVQTLAKCPDRTTPEPGWSITLYLSLCNAIKTNATVLIDLHLLYWRRAFKQSTTGQKEPALSWYVRETHCVRELFI